MPMTISLLYAPDGADPEDVFARHVVEEWTFTDGTMTIEPKEPAGESYRASDVPAWKRKVGEALQRHPAKATLLAGDESDDVHLRDPYNGLEYFVHDTGVEIYLRRGEVPDEDQFTQLWKVLRAIGRGCSCLAFYFDESIELDLNLRAREARRRYRI